MTYLSQVEVTDMLPVGMNNQIQEHKRLLKMHLNSTQNNTCTVQIADNVLHTAANYLQNFLNSYQY